MKLSSICLLALGVQMLLAPLATANKLCFVIYQMADNDLEYFIRQDLAEYMQSSLMKNPDTISWVYFDNGDPEAEGTPDPLPDIFDTAGNPLENRTQDVYYLSYNHEFKMQIVENLGELNSDTMSVVQDFATTAFRDCSEKGATEYMMAFSSHGAGFGGFGGDDVARRRRLGQLLDNGSISGALRSAIDSEIGVGAKLNVLGFDACLMSDYGALDDYSSITENFLASEDVEPGHGWSYAGLELDSAVNIATRIVDLFASDPQSEDGHQTPKTLAVVDTTAHMEFATKWEEFSRFLNIAFQEDENVQTAVKRARSKVLTFAGDTDDEGDKDEDMVDMMDFMNLFDGQCMPSGDLAIALMEAKNSYDAQFVTFKAGPSTDSRYTGMGVHFPSRKEFRANGLNFQVLESSRFATKTSPEWLDFLQTYYTSGTVFGSAGYCSSELATANPPQEEQGLLMVNPLVSGITTNGAHDIETGVVKRVDSVFIEFGVELTAILGDGTRRRRLKETRSSRGSHSVPMGKNADSRFLKHEFNKQSRRLQGGSDDYLYMYGGELVGSFSGSVYSASWDRQFGVAGNSANDQHPIYVFSDGAAGKETPVFYFPADKPISIEDIFNMVEFEDATAAGGMAGYIKFSTDAGVVPTLYTTQGGDGDSYSETPATAGGQIVPIVYVDGMIDGFDYFYFIGGYDPVAFDWSTNSPLIIGTLPADDFLLSESGVLTLDLTAEDEDNGDSSYALFEIVDGVATKVNEGADAAMDTDAPSDGGTDSPVETGPPTAVAPTQAPGGGNTTDPPAGGGGQTDAPAGDPTNPPTAAPMVTDAPRGGTADSSATAASKLFSMALTLGVAHLTFA